MTFHHKINSRIVFLRSPSDSYWTVPLIGTCMYILAFIIGYFLKLPILNIAGTCLLFLIVMIGKYKTILIIRRDLTINIAFLILLIPIVNTLINLESIWPIYFIKHIAIYSLYILIFSFGLPPLYETNKRKYFIAIISILLGLSIIGGKVFEYGGQVRLIGIFTNPNNLSLMALPLLFFINEDKDTVFKKGFLNLFVIIILIISSTAGAILAYIAANAYKYRKKFKKIYVSLPLIFLILLLIFYIQDLKQFQFTNKIITQSMVINEKYSDAISMEEINYGNLVSQYGTPSLSGIWRLSLWVRALYIISDSNIIKVFFGNGIGSSRQLLGALPHNEYLRIFLEQGTFGFILNIILFVIIWLRINSKYRYLLLMFAIFSFSENNIDNFLFMSLFIFFIASAQVRKSKIIRL